MSVAPAPPVVPSLLAKSPALLRLRCRAGPSALALSFDCMHLVAGGTAAGPSTVGSAALESVAAAGASTTHAAAAGTTADGAAALEAIAAIAIAAEAYTVWVGTSSIVAKAQLP